MKKFLLALAMLLALTTPADAAYHHFIKDVSADSTKQLVADEVFTVELDLSITAGDSIAEIRSVVQFNGGIKYITAILGNDSPATATLTASQSGNQVMLTWTKPATEHWADGGLWAALSFRSGAAGAQQVSFRNSNCADQRVILDTGGTYTGGAGCSGTALTIGQPYDVNAWGGSNTVLSGCLPPSQAIPIPLLPSDVGLNPYSPPSDTVSIYFPFKRFEVNNGDQIRIPIRLSLPSAIYSAGTYLADGDFVIKYDETILRHVPFASPQFIWTWDQYGNTQTCLHFLPESFFAGRDWALTTHPDQNLNVQSGYRNMAPYAIARSCIGNQGTHVPGAGPDWPFLGAGLVDSLGADFAIGWLNDRTLSSLTMPADSELAVIVFNAENLVDSTHVTIPRDLFRATVFCPQPFNSGVNLVTSQNTDFSGPHIFWTNHGHPTTGVFDTTHRKVSVGPSVSIVLRTDDPFDSPETPCRTCPPEWTPVDP